MRSCSIQPRFTTVIADFTTALSLLTVSLIGLMVVSAGMIVLAVMRPHLAEKARPVEAMPSRLQKSSLTLFPQISITQICNQPQVERL